MHVQIKRWAASNPGWALTSLFVTASKFDSAPTGSSTIMRFLKPKSSPKSTAHGSSHPPTGPTAESSAACSKASLAAAEPAYAETHASHAASNEPALAQSASSSRAGHDAYVPINLAEGFAMYRDSGGPPVSSAAGNAAPRFTESAESIPGGKASEPGRPGSNGLRPAGHGYIPEGVQVLHASLGQSSSAMQPEGSASKGMENCSDRNLQLMQSSSLGLEAEAQQHLPEEASKAMPAHQMSDSLQHHDSRLPQTPHHFGHLQALEECAAASRNMRSTDGLLQEETLVHFKGAETDLSLQHAQASSDGRPGHSLAALVDTELPSGIGETGKAPHHQHADTVTAERRDEFAQHTDSRACWKGGDEQGLEIDGTAMEHLQQSTAGQGQKQEHSSFSHLSQQVGSSFGTVTDGFA